MTALHYKIRSIQSNDDIIDYIAIVLSGETYMYKPKFHLVRRITTRHVRRVEPMYFGCVDLVEQRVSIRSSRRDRYVVRVVSCRDVTWRAKWNLGYS